MGESRQNGYASKLKLLTEELNKVIIGKEKQLAIH